MRERRHPTELVQPAQALEDRSLRVPAGHVVVTGYIETHRVRLRCRERMAIGDVEAAYRRVLANGGDAIHPTPNGRWCEDGEFELADGRHEYIARLMLGFEHILVTWIEPAPALQLQCEDERRIAS